MGYLCSQLLFSVFMNNVELQGRKEYLKTQAMIVYLVQALAVLHIIVLLITRG